MLNKDKTVEVIINKEKCTKCGSCMKVCANYLIEDIDGYPCANNVDNSLFGCIQCGHCMAICPTNAIEIKGEAIDESCLREINSNTADFESLNNLMLKRRSIRKFKQQEIDKDILDKIINAASTAPVGVPPSEVKVLVISSREKVQELADEMVNFMKEFSTKLDKFKIGKTSIALHLMKLFAGESQYKAFKDFVLPLCKEIIEKRKEGIDYLFYDAPAVMVFYSSELSDKDDYILAASQATLAAESLGLGTCIIGTVGELFKTNKKLRQKYGFEKTDKVGYAIILGYPDVKYQRGFQRSFKEVRYI